MPNWKLDTLGLLLSVAVHPASVQDRDGAGTVLRQARRWFPFVDRIFADGGYQGPKLATLAAATGAWSIEIVKRSDAHRFVVLPKRWIVERTFAWISRNRRLARDFAVFPPHYHRISANMSLLHGRVPAPIHPMSKFPRPAAASPADLPRDVRLQIASTCPEIPDGDGWLHEIKHDCHRLLAIVAPDMLKLVSRNRYES